MNRLKQIHLRLFAAALVLLGVLFGGAGIARADVMTVVKIGRCGTIAKGLSASEEVWGYSYNLYEMTSAEWYEDGSLKATPFTFAAGKKYYLKITVTALKHHTFTDNVGELDIQFWSGDVSLKADNPVEAEYITVSGDQKTLTIQTAAVKVEDTVTVTFDLGGHGTALKDLTLEVGGKVPEPAPPTDPDYTFVAWYDDPGFNWMRMWDFDGWTVYNDTTLYAKWVKMIPAVSVSGLAEPVTGEPLSTKDSLTIPAGADYDLQVLTWQANGSWQYEGKFEAGKRYRAQIGVVAKDGYGFPASLATSGVTLNGDNALLGDVIQVDYLYHDVFFYTVEMYPKCRITFDANGGSGGMEKQLVEYKTSYKLPVCGFTAPDGKEFDKWSLGAAGAAVEITDNTVIKAQWKDKPTAPAPTDPAPTDPAPADPAPADAFVPDGSTKGQATPANPASAEIVETAILKATNDKDPKTSTFGLLMAKGVPTSKTAIKLSWKKVKGAKKYVIYGNKCNTKTEKTRFEKIETVTGTSWTQKGLKKGTYYKYLIVAQDSSGKKALATSKTIHVATKGGKGKTGNVKGVKVSKKSVKVKAGKTVKVKATLKQGKPKAATHRAIAWESSDVRIATVSKGKIKGVKKGTCTVYAYAQNGTYAKIKVTVKK